MAITAFKIMNALSIQTSEETTGAEIIPFNWNMCTKFMKYI